MGKKLSLTPEQKRERSERAKRLVKEGKFGGPQPGAGRPRKKRASEIVAEKARDRAGEIVEAFEDLIENGPPAVRLQAAKDWLLIEQKEAELALKEERFGEDMSEDELRELVINRLAKINAAKEVEKLEGSITVEAEEVETKQHQKPELDVGGSPWGK